MTVKTFIVDCPVCKAKVAAEEKGCAERKGFDDYASEPYGMRLSVGECPRCHTLLAGSSHQINFRGWEEGEEDTWSDPVRVYPNPPKTFSSFRISNSVTVSLTEADNSLQANALFAACVMFGRALEAVCRDVLYTTEEKKAVLLGTSKKRLMLGPGIEQLRHKNIIDDRLYDWSQHLNAFRNLAAHPEGDSKSNSATRRRRSTGVRICNYRIHIRSDCGIRWIADRIPTQAGQHSVRPHVPLAVVNGSACPQSSEWCPQSIGNAGRFQSEWLAAFVGIRT